MSIFYIKQDGDDLKSGNSWTNAWKTLDRLTIYHTLVDNDVVVVRPGINGSPYYPSLTIRWWCQNVIYISEERALITGVISTKDNYYIGGMVKVDGTYSTDVGDGEGDIFGSDIQGIWIPGGPHNCSGFILDGFDFNNANRSAVWSSMPVSYSRSLSQDYEMRYCKIDKTGSNGLYIRNADGFLLERCEFTRCAKEDYLLGHATYFQCCDNIIMQDNVSHHNTGRNGFYINGGHAPETGAQTFCTNPIVRRNISFSNPSNGMTFVNVIGGRCESNLVYDVLPLFTDADAGIRVCTDKLASPSDPTDGLILCNNTVAVNGISMRGIWLQGALSNPSIVTETKNCIVFNNIAFSYNAGVAILDSSPGGLNFIDTVSNKKLRYSMSLLREYFIDPDNGNYKLRLDSPARNFAVSNYHGANSASDDLDRVIRQV